MNSATHHQEVTDLWWAGVPALALLGIGWLVCDAAGRLLGANGIASKILKSRDGLWLNSKGMACATRAHPDMLAEVVQRAATASATSKPEDRGAVFILRRARGKRPFTLLVRSVGAICWTDPCSETAVLVLILDPSLPVQATESDLHELYGFTARETRLATLLMDGRTLDASCGELGISRSTACTHLRHLFKKTRVHRQSELVSVLLKTIGMVRLRSAETVLDSQNYSDLVDRA